jgi:hypothetical protein
LAGCGLLVKLPLLLLLLMLAVCVSESLRTETLRENMGQCKSEGREIKENMGQCESQERNFKE